MRFEVIPNGERTPDAGSGVGYLWSDNWNDWFRYKTLYVLTIFDDDGTKHEIGSVKIGEFGMPAARARPDIPMAFDRLDGRFFSLGQDPQYYSNLMKMGADYCRRILSFLNDIVENNEIFERAKNEDITAQSLLRSVALKSIEGQFRRILEGGAVLTEYRFRYTRPMQRNELSSLLVLDFVVNPDSRPPTNIHVLVGRNGVGKTFLLNSMARALVPDASSDTEDGFFTTIPSMAWIPESRDIPFANILSISFSAFDDFDILRQERNSLQGIRYTNVGLRKRVKDKQGSWVTITRDPEDLAKEFSASARLCLRGDRARRWKNALNTLEADPLFQEAGVSSLVEMEFGSNESSLGRSSSTLYKRLSSGHKIVLLTITKLVEVVEEKTLVLIDEPEAHLHPPLLSAFVRALSDLLVNRNGVAIVATHSPVILQEVPRSCVWKINRHGAVAKAARPTIETFAENVGVLTSEVFGLEVTRSGFHKMLADALEVEDTFGDIVHGFSNAIGSEGRALLSSMVALKSSGDGE